MTVPIEITTMSETNKTVEIPTMIDCGAGGKFIDQSYARHFKVKKLDQPHQVYNVDGTENKKGTIRSYIDLNFTIDDRKFTEHLLVTGLGRQKIILGLPWPMEHNPKIDRKTRKMEWPKPRKIPYWAKIHQKSNENRMKLIVTISTVETMKRYTPNWMIIRQKTLENIERLKKK